MANGNTIRARYAGTCTATGRSYPAGTMIEKGSRGWQIAAGGATNAAPQPDRRHLRTPDGQVRETDISRACYCGACIKAGPGVQGFQALPAAAKAEYEMARAGADFTCSRCSRVAHVLSDEEVWAEVTLPRLHLTADGVLSEKLGPARWELVKGMFQYFRYSDLAEQEDEMDNFDAAEEYSRMRGGDWFLKHPHTAAEVEDALGILPENRRAAIEVREREERAAAEVAAAERSEQRSAYEAAKARLFPRDGGEYVPRGDGFDGRLTGTWVKDGAGMNIYGGGAEWLVEAGGAYVWYVRNNGMDGDDWSRNNIQTGGAGGIGVRYPLTEERREFLQAIAPIPLTLPEIKRALPEIKRALPEIKRALPEIKRALLAPAQLDAATWPADEAEIVKHQPAALWVQPAAMQEGECKLGADIARERVFALVPAPALREYGGFVEDLWALGLHGSGNGSRYALAWPASPERLAAIEPLLPAWAGSADPGRYLIDACGGQWVADNAADALRVAATWTSPLNYAVKATPGVTITHADSKVLQWSDGVTTRLRAPYTFYSARRQRAEMEEARREFERDEAARVDRGEQPLGNRDWSDPYAAAGFPDPPPLPGDPAALSPAASELLHLALGHKAWREGDRAQVFATAAEIASKEQLDEQENRSHSSGSWSKLARWQVRFADGTERALYVATMGYWSMGEDGDADEWSELYEDEAAARAACREWIRK